jgi:hypothetical protein
MAGEFWGALTAVRFIAGVTIEELEHLYFDSFYRSMPWQAARLESETGNG